MLRKNNTILCIFSPNIYFLWKSIVRTQLKTTYKHMKTFRVCSQREESYTGNKKNNKRGRNHKGRQGLSNVVKGQSIKCQSTPENSLDYLMVENFIVQEKKSFNEKSNRKKL